MEIKFKLCGNCDGLKVDMEWIEIHTCRRCGRPVKTYRFDLDMERVK
ncbi:hypothetical protein LCGC14_1380360 [marine sediment metagenome]|uniref:Uncharacterized protein n=1 Tax=marine sediment metagenome TaxID=412755 RepID=A0A0F9KNR1_9ZZZZ